jgi:hypothetical protein
MEVIEKEDAYLASRIRSMTLRTQNGAGSSLRGKIDWKRATAQGAEPRSREGVGKIPRRELTSRDEGGRKWSSTGNNAQTSEDAIGRTNEEDVSK